MLDEEPIPMGPQPDELLIIIESHIEKATILESRKSKNSPLATDPRPKEVNEMDDTHSGQSAAQKDAVGHKNRTTHSAQKVHSHQPRRGSRTTRAPPATVRDRG
jgi:hypothetical protein